MFYSFKLDSKNIALPIMSGFRDKSLDSNKSYSTNYLSCSCEIKSRYSGIWEYRSLTVALDSSKIIVGESKSIQYKEYPLEGTSYSREPKKKTIKLKIPEARIYEIKETEKTDQMLAIIALYKKSQQLNSKVKEQTIQLPKKINYYSLLRPHSFEQSFVPFRSSIILKKQLEDYERVESYFKTQDWEPDSKHGGLLFINHEKKQNIGKLVAFVCKRVLTTGSFIGISFPTFAMKPESMLETYCKCLGTVPILLENVGNDPLQRLKAFNVIVHTFSMLITDIDKSFNPSIGETFQGSLGGYEVYAEQTCHNPPISSFLLDGKDYVLHGSLELTAKLGLNSAEGIFYGDIILQFDDGGVIKGKMQNGLVSGTLFGETRFHPTGGVYSYDPINQLVSSYKFVQKDIMRGYIGRLRPKSQTKFMSMMDSKDKQKFEDCKVMHQSDFVQILSKIEISWVKWVKYDNKTYFDPFDASKLPLKLTQQDLICKGEVILQSDSSNRPDIQLRAQNLIEQSQAEKQRIEEQERRLRNLRKQN